LIEDDYDAGDAITAILEGQHYTVFRSFDAFDGIAQIRAGLSPDLILLDLMMPCLSERELRAMKQHDSLLSTIPIVALSAPDSPKACLFDVDAVLTKPIEALALLEAVHRTFEAIARRRSDEEAAQQERLSSLGVMAAGLAHEVNNPLASLLGNLELASRRCNELLHELEGPQAQVLSNVMRFMSDAQAGGTQIAEVVRGVSAFVRPDTERVVSFDVQAVLESSLRLAANELRHRARLERAYCQVPHVIGNESKLSQVFLNLLINAAHAVGDDNRSGLIRVAVRSSGDRVVVSIADNGPGMSPGIAARIFDPFFSTKPRGQGLGLGLALSQRSVQMMGGCIRVESEPGKGSVFYVSLPASSSALRTDSMPEAISGVMKALPRARRLRVLIVDDEEMMCTMLAATLGDDYDVTTCVDSRVVLGELSSQAFDVILCDLMMPILNGMELHRELLHRRPELAGRMLFMTGGTFTDSARSFLDDGTRRYIKKPFDMDEMVRLLKLVAASPGANAEARRCTLRSN
jgi:signal transduction histidine kinase/ActR/RegA family two-component response regulator